MMGCWLCEQIENGRYKLYEDDDVFVTLATKPAARGETIIAVKRHVGNFHDLTELEVEEMAKSVHRFVKKITTQLNPKKVYVVSLNDWVEHVHFTLYPRYNDIGPIGFVSERKDLDGKDGKELLEKLAWHSK
jgi:diadenosine tetraphosphate (Ap4A) HIT family hydrolase